MSSASEELNPTNQHIASVLRARRAENGWSLDRAAQATGVSKAMLGQIERGESSPTVATLWKIATGFGASLSSFIEPTPPAGMSETLWRSASDIRSQPGSEGMLVAPLFPFEARLGYEFFELTLLPGYERLSEAHAAGVTEHVIVVRGVMQVLVDGLWRELGAGQAVRFAADGAHGYRNCGLDDAVFHNLIHYAADPRPAASSV